MRTPQPGCTSASRLRSYLPVSTKAQALPIGVSMKTVIATLLLVSIAASAWAQAATVATPAAGSARGAARGHTSASYALKLGHERDASEHELGPPAFDARAGRGIELGGVAGFGWSFDDTVGAVNPLGLGLGLRGGAHIGRLYLGARAHAYLGGRSELPTGRLDMSQWLLAAEAGYDFDWGRWLVVRPGLLLGVAFFTQDGPSRSIPGGYIGGTQDDTYGRLYIAPGASLMWPLAQVSRDLSMLYVGLDLRLGLFVGEPTSVGIESGLNVGVAL